MYRVCTFIDGSNFYHALKGAKLPVSVDLGKLGTELTGPDRRHIHTYYYNAALRPRFREDSRLHILAVCLPSRVGRRNPQTICCLATTFATLRLAHYGRVA